jgi:hypothetical protein
MRWSFGFGKLEKKTIVKLKKNKECQTSSTGYPVNKLKKRMSWLHIIGVCLKSVLEGVSLALLL